MTFIRSTLNVQEATVTPIDRSIAYLILMRPDTVQICV